MSVTEFVRLIAASLAVAFVVSVIAYAVSSSMEQDEDEDAERLRVRLGVGPIRVHGMPEGEFKPSDVQVDDPYVRAMIAASMNAGVPIRGEIALNGDLHITKDAEPF